jgi:hypothetical protein
MCTTPEVSEAATAVVELPSALPHDTTLPSVFRAAKANSVGNILITPLVSCPATAAVFPPVLSDPQATTLPSVFTTAQEPEVEYARTTPEVRDAETLLASPPYSVLPQTTALPSARSATKEPLALF